MSGQNSTSSASPFPGMDPYLEESKHWRGFHGHLAVEIVRSLNQRMLYPDGDVALDFGLLFDDIYAINHYHLLIDYTQKPPSPKLRPEMAAWWTKQQQGI